MNKKNRLIAIEKQMAANHNGGLRVVTPIGCHYGEECKPYWTDEPVKGMEALYSDEPYKEVQHPDGLIA